MKYGGWRLYLAWYYWIIAGVALGILEALTPEFFPLVPAIAAVVTGIVAVFVPDLKAQLAVFACVTALLAVLFRRMILSSFSGEDPYRGANANGMIGKRAKVTAGICNREHRGYIRFQAVRHPARSADGEDIPAGEDVVIKDISGITAIVERAGKQ